MEIVNYLLPCAFRIIPVTGIFGKTEKIISEILFVCVLWFRLRKAMDLKNTL